MAFDGIVTRAMVREINEKIYMGKIEKVYQPKLTNWSLTYTQRAAIVSCSLLQARLTQGYILSRKTR